jgi:DNA-binding LacI/PurR family transcriptional regulator
MLPKNFAAVIVLRQDSGRQHPFERGAHGKAFVAAMRQSGTVSSIDSDDADTASQLRFHIIDLQQRVRVCRPAYLRGGEGESARASQDKCPT